MQITHEPQGMPRDHCDGSLDSSRLIRGFMLRGFDETRSQTCGQLRALDIT